MAIPRLVSTLAVMLLLTLAPTDGARAAASTQSATLSDSVVATKGKRVVTVDYAVAFGASFAAVTQVDYVFTFGTDPLDPGECLYFGIDAPLSGFPLGGFCNMGTTAQTGRVVTLPRALHPEVCDALLDGTVSGQITVNSQAKLPNGRPRAASVALASLMVTVHDGS